MMNRILALRHDVISGVVVFLVALPLCLGIAQAVGAPPLAGLLSGIIGGLIITVVSPSPLSVSGPAAGLIALVLGSVATLGSMSAVLTALVLAGVLQIIMGLARFGRLAGLIPGSVVRGLLAAIGLMLIIQQIPVALGYVPDKIWFEDASLHAFSDITPGSVIIMLGSLLLLVLWEMSFWKRTVFAKVPAPLVVVLWGMLALTLLPATGDWSVPLSQRVQLPELSLNGSWPLPLPDWSMLTNPQLYKVAFSLALIASLETLLSLEAVSKIDPQRRAPHSDRELVAQGSGNLVSGLLGGLPLTAVIVRSSANVYAGARTRFSAFFHGILLLLSALLLSPLLNSIPLASLSAILIFTGYRLASPTLFKSLWQQGKRIFIPFAVTVVGIIGIGMLEGIALGCVCQLLMSVTQAEKNTVALTRQGNLWLLRIHQNITFMSKPELCRLLDSIPDGSKVHIETAPGVVLAPDLLEAIDNFRSRGDTRALNIDMPETLRSQLSLLTQAAH